MSRSLNQVTLIGNLVRDPELRYTPQNTPICTFSLATNRSWKTESGENKESVEYHRIVAWDKLGEICSKLLKKGSRAYVQGRLQTRKWQAQDGSDRYMTEIVITDMMVLDKRDGADDSSTSDYQPAGEIVDVPADFGMAEEEQKPAKASPKKKEESAEDDIPF